MGNAKEGNKDENNKENVSGWNYHWMLVIYGYL
jgi:hypothetical protein